MFLKAPSSPQTYSAYFARSIHERAKETKRARILYAYYLQLANDENVAFNTRAGAALVKR